MGSLLTLRLFLTAVALCACDRAPRAPDPAAARDLSRALTPATNAADTAARRRQAELERCKFVYHDEQGLRECLVLKNGWEPQDAAREIAIYKAQIARRIDSLQNVRDDIRIAQFRKREREAAYAARQPYWGEIARRIFYTNTPNCDTLWAFTFSQLRFFRTSAEAERAGYARTDRPGC